MFRNDKSVMQSIVCPLLLATLLVLHISFAHAPFAKAQQGTSTDPVAELRRWLDVPVGERTDIASESFAKAPLDRPQSELARQLLWADHVSQAKAQAATVIEQGVVKDGEYSMQFVAKNFGQPSTRGHSLYLSLHGGGGTAKRVNDSQWRNQQRLYDLKEGIYVAPRAPTDTWNLWHQAHIDNLFRQIIHAYIVTGQVDPDRVYILGYSAGGDGVYQLAPRMADSLAAAAMMAGHPNEASPLGLRNIGFTIHVGGNDSAYNRNQVARQWGEKLDSLQRDDPDGYEHETVIHEGKGHWMDREDTVALEFLAQFNRNSRPDKVVWFQDDVTRDRFYWLHIDPAEAKAGMKVVAAIVGQDVVIEHSDLRRLYVRLDDRMVNLDQPVRIRFGEQDISAVSPQRNIATLYNTLVESRDPELMWTCEIAIEVPPAIQ